MVELHFSSLAVCEEFETETKAERRKVFEDFSLFTFWGKVSFASCCFENVGEEVAAGKCWTWCNLTVATSCSINSSTQRDKISIIIQYHLIADITTDSTVSTSSQQANSPSVQPQKPLFWSLFREPRRRRNWRWKTNNKDSLLSAVEAEAIFAVADWENLFVRLNRLRASR